MRTFALGLVVGIVCGLSVALLLVLPDRDRGTGPTPVAATPTIPAPSAPSKPLGTRDPEANGSSSRVDEVRRLMREYRDHLWHYGSPTELTEVLSAMSATEQGIPLDLFAELLRHPTFGFRAAALARWRSVVPDPRPLMRQIMNSEEDAGFRQEILAHLARQESVRRTLLMEALENPAANFRAYAVEQLTEFSRDDDALRRRLVRMHDDPSFEVRKIVLLQLPKLGPEGGEVAARVLISGDHPHDLGYRLAATAVVAGRTLDVLRGRSDVVTARLLLEAVCREVDFEEEMHLISPLAGDLDRWFGRVPRGPDAAVDLVTIAAALGQKDYVRKLLDDPSLSLDARDLTLQAALDFPSTRRLAILTAERWILDVGVPGDLRCQAMWRVCDAIDEERDPEYGRWWKAIRKLADGEESFWVRETAKDYLKSYDPD